MTRLSLSPTRAPRWPALIVALMMLVPGAALASGLERQPMIEQAPSLVGFMRHATVVARLDGGVEGDEVTLEKIRPDDDSWAPVSTQEIDESGRATFDLGKLRTTADYRVVWADPYTVDGAISEEATIRVKGRVVLKAKPADLLSGRVTRLRGQVYPLQTGRRVALQRKIDGVWRRVAAQNLTDDGFSFRYEPKKRGRITMRVLFRGDVYNAGARNVQRIRVYRRSRATWYGPGLYGRGTACGQTLTRDTLGVAHRTLPCGTEVSFLYKGKTITVPVIDRGPYAHADWDLTSKVAERLGFGGTDDIGVSTTF